MKDLTTLLLLCPFVLPVLGAGIIWLWPSHNAISSGRRGFYLATLLAVCAALLALSMLSPQTSTWSYGRSGAWYYDLLEFSSSGISLGLTALFMLSWVVLAVTGWRLPLGRREAAFVLLLVGLVNAALFSANLLTLCVTWGILDLALLAWQVYQAQERDLNVILRRLAGNLLSTLFLMAAAVLIGAYYRQSHYGYFTASGTSLSLLILAALLRIGAFPFPASLKYRWEILLISLCTGGFLWLQIAHMLPQSHQGNWWVTLGVLSLVATALLAAFSRELTDAWPFVLLHGISMLLLGPLLGGGAGAGAAFLALAGLSVSLTIMRLDVLLEPIPPLGAWVRLPLVVALATLCGWPLTAGLLSRWAFLEIAWEVGRRDLFLWASLSFLLASVPIWRQLRQVRYRMRRSSAHLPHPEWQIGATMALILAAGLIMAGIWPQGLQAIWQSRTLSLSLPNWPDLWLVGPHLTALLVLALLVGPLAGSFLISRLLGAPSSRLLADVRPAVALLRLEWAYALLERGALIGRRLTRHVTYMIQDSFYLGWVLAWALLIVLYFAER